MTSSGMSSSLVLARFLVVEPNFPENLLARQASPPHSGEATGPLASNIPQEVAHESTTGPADTSPWLRTSCSDEGSVTGSSESILSSRSSYSSEDATPSILSIPPSDGSVDINIGRPSRLPCVFLRCSVSFGINSTSRDDWYSHSLAHFGLVEPPIHSLCIFCDRAFSDRDPWKSWQERMQHIGDHLENGKTIEQSRPDFALFKHLWHHGLLSETEYQHIISYTERPPVENLRPYNWVPKEVLERRNKDFETRNGVIIDQWSEDRFRKKLARREGIRMKQERTQENQRIASTIRTYPITKSVIVSDPVSERPILADNYDQSCSEVANLVTPVVQEATRISSRTSEADRYLSDPRSLLDDLCDSDSDASCSSQDKSINGYVETSYNAGAARCSETNPHLDYDADEDLMSPGQYKQQLENIQESIFKNSVAILLKSYQQLSVHVRIPRLQNVSIPVPSHSEMLERIEQNIRTLQSTGFCQGKLSFLMLDPIRKDVASLISVPVDQFLNLRPRNAAGDSEDPEAPQLQQSASLTPKPPTERIVISQGTKEHPILERRLRTNTSSLNQSDVITPPTSSLAVPEPRPSVSRVSDSTNSSPTCSSPTSSSSTYSKDEYPNPTSATSMSVSVEKREFHVRETLLRVPDPYPGILPVQEILK